MAHASFGSPWPNCQPGNMVTLVRSDGLRVPVHHALVGLVSLLIDLTEMMGYDVLPGQTWGFACRAISGTRKASFHSQGSAIDLNAPSNPYASVEWHTRNATAHPFGLPRVTNIPQAVFELWENHGFRLGVKYETKPDPMHVEFMGTTADAAAIEKRLRDFLGNAPPPPEEPVDYDRIQDMIDKAFNDRGLNRSTPEEIAAKKPGGSFGKTRRTIRNMAKKMGLPEDQIEA